MPSWLWVDTGIAFWWLFVGTTGLLTLLLIAFNLSIGSGPEDREQGRY